jgi:glycosyltransferase involved in cell wall biosynthesis
MSRIWCGIPVFNNAATILDVARRCREQIANAIVVDDGSTDADLRDLLKGLDIAVVRHQSNLGKGVALLTAFRYAADHGAEYLLILDGDGQHFPEDIPHFLSQLTPHTILLGSREEISGIMPRSSLFGREFSDFWIYVESGQAVKDSQSGFRVYPVNDSLQLGLRSRHYNLEMEILTRSIWAGLRTASVPIRVWYPDPSQTASSFRPFLDNLRISLLHTRLVLRQLLPIPHRRLPGAPGPLWRTPAQWLKHLCTENSTPLGLAAVTMFSLLLGIVLWPWGPLAIAYLVIRLHLNKIVAIVIAAACAPPKLAAFCMMVGRSVLGSHANGHLVWFIGSHIVAFTAAPLLGLLVYTLAKRFKMAGNRK